MKTERIIDISDKPVEDTRPTEVPHISIEKSNSDAQKPRWRPNLWGLFAAVVVILTLIAVYFFNIGDDDSEITGNNISLLEEPYEPTSVGTERVTDTILGVTMDMYPLGGLKASLETALPDTADRSLVLFMRSADYHPDGRAIGPVIVGGESRDFKAEEFRDGYVAISPSGRAVIGISSDDVIDGWVEKNKGSLFRQMILLNDGQLPRDFLLKGKVERAAIASMVGGELYYVVTQGKETMYDFADALREYGFIDAVYMTGGNAYSFFRDREGEAHLNDATEAKLEKYKTKPLPQPLLVFRCQR